MWSPARCPLAGQGPSLRRCGLPRALSTKESANASVDPRAMASSPQRTAALTSSCTSQTWKESTSQWKATRSPIRCALSRPRTRSCRLWKWSSPTWRRAPSTRPGLGMSSAPRRPRAPVLPGLRETVGEEEETKWRWRCTYSEMQPQSSTVPFKLSLVEGAWGPGPGMGVVAATSTTSDHHNNLSPSEKH